MSGSNCRHCLEPVWWNGTDLVDKDQHVHKRRAITGNRTLWGEEPLPAIKRDDVPDLDEAMEAEDEPVAVVETETGQPGLDDDMDTQSEAAAILAGQGKLFHLEPAWSKQWDGMPEFVLKDAKPFDSINVQFRNAEDRKAFLVMLGHDEGRRKSIWYPHREDLRISTKGEFTAKVEPNRYPIYVISKGRWEQRITAAELEYLGIDYRIVVEPQELGEYSNVIDARKILVLPFSNLGQGSIPARNWVWEHAVAAGARRHWILDDNLYGFYRLNRNVKVKITDENPFTPIEEFADRYDNVALAGMNYEFFADRRSPKPPFILNTRIYSCILIQNDIPYRWRGRYNEDTDLSIRALKDGWCTVLFNAYLAKKVTTMTMTGGNTDELYQGDGRLKMAESLVEQHPDVVRVTTKWGRPQHHVDYRAFRGNRLRPVDAGDAA